jgi:murein DD-endopeptidase MepM/ murein hydrolase activator NlpD
MPGTDPLGELDRSLRRFDRLARQIRRPRGGRRWRKTAIGAFLGALVLAVAIPPFRYPVGGRVSSTFFFRHRPESVSPLAIEMHDGLDIAAPAGTPVLASAAGVVTHVGSDAVSGNWVRVRHLFGIGTFYGHLSETLVRPGTLVLLRSLRPIGRVGSTGRSTGPHVHFEIAVGGVSLPPRVLLFWHDLRRLVLRR